MYYATVLISMIVKHFLALALSWTKLTFLEFSRKRKPIPLSLPISTIGPNFQYLLIQHRIGDGKRRLPLLALTIDGFKHSMFIQVLLNPDEE